MKVKSRAFQHNFAKSSWQLYESGVRGVKSGARFKFCLNTGILFLVMVTLDTVPGSLISTYNPKHHFQEHAVLYSVKVSQTIGLHGVTDGWDVFWLNWLRIPRITPTNFVKRLGYSKCWHQQELFVHMLSLKMAWEGFVLYIAPFVSFSAYDINSSKNWFNVQDKDDIIFNLHGSHKI